MDTELFDLAGYLAYRRADNAMAVEEFAALCAQEFKAKYPDGTGKMFRMFMSMAGYMWFGRVHTIYLQQVLIHHMTFPDAYINEE